MDMLGRIALLVTLMTAVAAQVGSLDDLKPLLSDQASIYLPGSSEYAEATLRWDASTQPGLDAVVNVATEADVQRTIEYANDNDIPFLAIGNKHGGSRALNQIQNGIGILLRGLQGVSITADGKEAVIQAGHTSGEVIHQLWDMSKITVTGGCDCTGFISPALGGGHGWLQGRYGLLADNLVSARLVLANGTALTVDSQSPDLYWALRGAGHNFGIVTSVNYRVYDIIDGQDGFATATFTFRQDNIDAVYSIANQWLAATNRPVELSHFTNVVFNTTVDDKPIFNFMVYWQGDAIPASYTDPLNALEPVSVTENWLDIANINANNAATEDGPACAKGSSHRTYPVDLVQYDAENLKTAMAIFGELPADFVHSSIMIEAFAMNRVQEIAADSTAYANRESKILASPLLTYPADDSELDAVALDFGKRLREALLDGTGLPLSAYVNYANGDESNEATYGYDSWRIERLRALKKVYDPMQRFSFYEPIEI